MQRSVDQLARIVVNTAFEIHRDLGPGLLEAAYEMILFEKLRAQGVAVRRQVPIDIEYSGVRIANAFKIDLLVDERLIVELKAVDTHVPVHAKQVLTYLRLTGQPLGLLINFGTATFKEGVRRLVNGHNDEGR
jgi:iron complex transport system substrate-binding protein